MERYNYLEAIQDDLKTFCTTVKNGLMKMKSTQSTMTTTKKEHLR